MKNFGGSVALSLFGLGLAGIYAWVEQGSWNAVLADLWIVSVLAVLEISLSFDNAVVNAAVLADMDPAWQRRFLTWGMLIAVLGTRVVFPLAIVGFAAGLGPVEAVRLSLADPARYEAILTGAHLAIAGFGGAFLVMVGLGFFVDPDKEVHWLGWIERRLAHAGSVKAAEIAVVLIVLAAIARALAPAQGLTFVLAGIAGLVAFVMVDGLGAMLESRAQRRALTGAVARAGLGSFLYLNLLDASFSLDGVIGAFALTNNMVIIAIGLSIGALFVRSLTLLMVRAGTLSEYRFLEHGAFWAIIALGLIMLGSALIEVPEALTGLIGAVLIAASVWWSVRHKHAGQTA